MKISILGTGVYGIALAKSLNNNKNNNIKMWTRFEEEANELTEKRFSKNMSDITIDKDIIISSDLNYVVDNTDVLVIAIPSQFLNSFFIELKEVIKDNQHICIASKGLDETNIDFFSNTLNKLDMDKNLCFISGPTFAHEMALKYPMGLSLASKNKNSVDIITKCFENTNVNLIPIDDIIGLQFLGTVKNVLAILFGIAEGAKYSISTKSYLITKILNELKQIIINIGGNPDTILNLCGIGDIWLTCNSDQSRNFTLGKMIGENKDKIEIDNYLKETTVEGLMNLNILIELLDKYKQDTKTFKLIHDLIYKKEDVDKLLKI